MDRLEPSPGKAIFFKIMSVLMIVVMLTCVKAVQDVPVGEIVFFRCFLSIVPFWIWLRWRGESMRSGFRTNRPMANVTRSLLGVTTITLSIIAVRALPLPEAVTLGYTQPLFVVALSALLLAERVRLVRWGAVVFGFAGVVVITWPNLSMLSGGGAAPSRDELLGAGAALTAAATHATTILVIRELVRTERPITIVLWFWMVSSIVLGLTAFFGWVMLTPSQAALLLVAGLFGGLAQMSMAEGLRYAPASMTASFEYASLIFATLLGFLVFGDIPGMNTLTGGAMVIAAGVMIMWRERTAAARHGRRD